MDLKKTWRGLKERWRMYRELREQNEEADVRKVLFWEFVDAVVLNSDALRRRHHNEQVFKRQIEGRWQ